MTEENQISKEAILYNDLNAIQKKIVYDYNEDIIARRIKLEDRFCLCGKNESILISKVDRYGFYHRVVLCDHCGLLYARPRPDKDSLFDFYSSGRYRTVYSNNMDEKIYDDYLNNSRDLFMAILEVLKGRILSNKTVLDFGCGGGWNLELFHKSNFNVLGCDLDPEMVEIGKKRGLNLTVGSYEIIENKEFNIIILNHVVEHFMDFWKEISLIKRSLSSNGILYISTPNIALFGCGRLQNAHNYYFTLPVLRYFMNAAGFRLLNYGYMYNFQDFFCIFEHSTEIGLSTLYQEKEMMKEFLTSNGIIGEK